MFKEGILAMSVSLSFSEEVGVQWRAEGETDVGEEAKNRPLDPSV